MGDPHDLRNLHMFTTHGKIAMMFMALSLPLAKFCKFMLMTKHYFPTISLKGFRLHVLNFFQPQRQRQLYSQWVGFVGKIETKNRWASPPNYIGFPNSIFPTPSETHNLISRRSYRTKKNQHFLLGKSIIFHDPKNDETPAKQGTTMVKVPWSTAAWSWSSRHCECRAPPRWNMVDTSWRPLEDHGRFFFSGEKTTPIFLSICIMKWCETIGSKNMWKTVKTSVNRCAMQQAMLD